MRNDEEKRRYDDACGTAHGMDLVGERWALLVARELLLGPKRFNELRADLPGLSANVLTQRLEGLEASGVLRRHKLPPPASVQVYELTDWGYGLAPVITELGRWVRTLALRPGKSALSSLKRFGPSNSSRATSSAHRSPTRSMPCAVPQASS